MTLEPKEWCYKTPRTALLRFIFPNSFTCFDMSPNGVFLQNTRSTPLLAALIYCKKDLSINDNINDNNRAIRNSKQMTSL